MIDFPYQPNTVYHPIYYTMIVRLSLLTMTNRDQMRELLLLCVLKWLMRPILALKCLLKMEQEKSEEESSVGDAFAEAFS